MRIVFTLVAATGFFMLLAPMQADDKDKQDKTRKGGGEVVMENYYSSSVDLYVDGRYACSAPGNGGSCTTRVRVGPHKLEARTADGQSWKEPPFDMPKGYVYKFAVWKG